MSNNTEQQEAIPEIGDLLPYTNTHGKICKGRITSLAKIASGKYWWHGIDIRTNAAVYYPLQTSLNLREYADGELREAVKLSETKDDAVFWNHRCVDLSNQLAAKEKEIQDYRKALIDIRDNGGGKLCREDRSRMGKIAFDVLNKYPSPNNTQPS